MIEVQVHEGDGISFEEKVLCARIANGERIYSDATTTYVIPEPPPPTANNYYAFDMSKP